MTTHYNAGADDARLAECGAHTDSWGDASGRSAFTCKRCRGVLDARNRRCQREAAERLFGALNYLHAYGREGLAEEVRALAVDLHNGKATPLLGAMRRAS